MKCLFNLNFGHGSIENIILYIFLHGFVYFCDLSSKSAVFAVCGFISVTRVLVTARLIKKNIYRSF